MNRIIAAISALGIACTAMAADAVSTEITPENSTPQESVFSLAAAARFDWDMIQYDGKTADSQTGFHGKQLVTRIDGRIVKGLTYSWRQRFNKFSRDMAFFDATDWIYLDYAFSKFNFTAGKQVVAIGGWEYDRNPIDIFAGSLFWNNINCYEFGLTAGYNVTADDHLMLQVTQSPFFTAANRNMYAYNIMWTAHHGIFAPIYSLNLLEYEKGRYISYIVLGNKFNIGNVSIELDLMNRAASHQTFFFKDMSVMGDVAWQITDRWGVRGKLTYDVNHSGRNADYTVFDGTEMTMAGGDVEYYPLLKNKHTLRLHAGCWYAWGNNANKADAFQDKTLYFSAGITWNMNLLDIKSKR